MVDKGSKIVLKQSSSFLCKGNVEICTTGCDYITKTQHPTEIEIETYVK